MNTNPSPDQKIALITGANRGLGLETARTLAKRGYHVVITGRDEASCKEAAAEVDGEYLVLDVADAGSISAAAASFSHDRLDVLVNNAGIFIDRDESILTVSVKDIQSTLQTNLLGPLLVTRAFRRRLEKTDGARIINLSSTLGQLDQMEDGGPSYGISKTALNAMTRKLASAFAESGVVVNSMSPGWVRTDMGGESADRTLEDGVDTIVWLATEAPLSITGQFIKDRASIPW